MTTSENNGEPQENYYDFFAPDLWLARVDGMVWLLRMTYDVIDGTLGGLDGLTVAKCQQLLQEIAAKKKQPPALDLDYDLLEGFLTGLVQKGTLPLAAPDPAWAVDFDFEVKQLINLRSLCITYIYFFADMRRLIEEALTPSPVEQQQPLLPLIQACYQYLGNDFELLQRAFLQRQPSVESTGQQVTGVLAKELVMTDKLAMKTLAPFAHLLANPSLFTLFSQETHIRHLPFSDQLILVGLSHGRISLTYNEQMRSGEDATRKPLPAFELLAIPHEIGHYLYDHAQLESTAASSTPPQGHFANLSTNFHDNPYHHWCEELFADLFGCVVAGPLTVLSMQALLATGDPARLWQEDGDHPTAAVRPYLLAEMLRVLAKQESALAQQANTATPARYQFAQAAHSLDANWSAVLQRLGIDLVDLQQGRPAQIKGPANTAAVIDVDQVIKRVTPILTTFASQLLTHAHFAPDTTAESAILATAIPWVRADQPRLTAYTDALVALCSATLAQQKVTEHRLLPLNFWDERWRSSVQGTTAAEKLQHWLDQWRDSGPRTIGGH